MVSVITATYNRAYLIQQLYQSLVKQKNNNFEWIVIDDGSIDETKELIKGYILEGKINIIYKYQLNSGKHKALNRAIEISNKELIFFVDSDDYLDKDAIEFIIKEREKIRNDSSYAGLSGSKRYSDGNIIGNLGEIGLNEFIDANSFEYRYKFNVTGDKAEVFRKTVIQQFKFPEFEGEKFIPEALVYNRIANDGYRLRWFNKPICVCEYREDGLSAQGGNLFANSWSGYSLYLKEMLKYKNIPIILKFKLTVNYLRMVIKYKKSIFTLLQVKE